MSFHEKLRARAGAALLAAFVALSVGGAFAETEEELLAKRALWQDRYRVLLNNQAILEDNIAKLRHNYAQAQRRNYPRGGAREAFREQAEEQEATLAEVRQELEAIFQEARSEGIPPGWLYEVDDEPIVLPSQPASPASDEDAVDREGRNPVWFEDEDAEEDDR